MRPVRRGPSPLPHDFSDYADAKPELVSRLGPYCSYCERRIAANLAVEHIQPKALSQYQHLSGRWENFLLACVNCNSSKLNKDVQPGCHLLPDRDNTFAALTYRADGSIEPSPAAVAAGLTNMVNDTLRLVGLDKAAAETPDQNGRQVALDRVRQRMEAWLAAQAALSDIQQYDSPTLRQYVIKLALQSGFFSVWMTVFAGDADMRNRLTSAFPGTLASGCFDQATGASISPAPNPDQLTAGGKL